MDEVFKTLNALNVNEYTEKKEGLTYLTWSSAWAEIKKLFPQASYTIWKSESGLPYVYDPLTGFMVYTSVTIDGVTHEMWLPVMDSKNKAMKAEAYTYKTKYGEKTVDPATMFDINKTIMRCLVKNLAMFGLGLYIYAGEDLPEGEETDQPVPAKREAKKPAPAKPDPVEEASAKAKVMAYINRHQMSKESVEKICKAYNIESIQQMSLQMCNHYIKALEKSGGDINN